MLHRIRTIRTKGESGFALPLALLLTLVIAASTAFVTQNSVQQLRITQGHEATQDTFIVSEGIIHLQLSQMILSPETWKVLTVLPEPEGYESFQLGALTETNGIPTCSSKACQRHLYPTGGGLLKNVGPIDSDGSIVDISRTVTDQIDPSDPPEVDFLANQTTSGWVQVEKLDTAFDPNSGVGASLTSQGNGFGNATTVRYRLTGYAKRLIRGREGQSTVVAIVGFPGA